MGVRRGRVIPDPVGASVRGHFMKITVLLWALFSCRSVSHCLNVDAKRPYRRSRVSPVEGEIRSPNPRRKSACAEGSGTLEQGKPGQIFIVSWRESSVISCDTSAQWEGSCKRDPPHIFCETDTYHELRNSSATSITSPSSSMLALQAPTFVKISIHPPKQGTISPTLYDVP